MSTNFYWKMEHNEESPPKARLANGDYIPYIKPEQLCHEAHIGKRSALDGGMAFTWAVSPYHVYKKMVQCCDYRYGDPNCIVAVDEYGREYTAKEFKTLLDDCEVWRLHAIGQDFC